MSPCSRSKHQICQIREIRYKIPKLQSQKSKNLHLYLLTKNLLVKSRMKRKLMKIRNQVIGSNHKTKTVTKKWTRKVKERAKKWQVQVRKRQNQWQKLSKTLFKRNLKKNTKILNCKTRGNRLKWVQKSINTPSPNN